MHGEAVEECSTAGEWWSQACGFVDLGVKLVNLLTWVSISLRRKRQRRCSTALLTGANARGGNRGKLHRMTREEPSL
jgi:hypothetical protein